MIARRISARRAVGLVGAAVVCVVLFSSSDPSRACDTWVAMGDQTTCGYTILGKNSDRPTFGCQPLVFHRG